MSLEHNNSIDKKKVSVLKIAAMVILGFIAITVVGAILAATTAF